MEPERLWWCGEGGWSERDPGADYGDEYAALPRADFDALVADASEARTLRTERDSLRQERDGLLHTSDKQTVAWKQRALMAEQERDDLARLAYIDHEHRFPDATWKARCDELVPDLRAATARADALAALLKEAAPFLDKWRKGYPLGIRARIDAELEKKK